MSENKITQKPLYQKLKGTIALRVFYLSLALIVIPMIFHTVWMYQHDYTQRQKELIFSLNILAESRAALIEEVIEDKLSLLNLIEYSPFFINHIEQKIFDLDLRDYLQKVSKEFDLSEIFFVSYENNKLICSVSSNEKMVGENFSDYPFLSERFGMEHFSVFGVLPYIQEKRLIVGKTLYDQGTPIGLLLAATPTTHLVQRLASYVDAPYDIDVSLLMKNGIIFSSSDPDLNMRTIYPLKEQLIEEVQQSKQIGNLPIYQDEYSLTPLKNIPNGYELIGKENSFAVQAFVKDTMISVILDVDEIKILAIQTKEYLFILSSLLISIVIIGGGGALFLTLKMARPFKKLQNAMAKVAKGDLSARYIYDKMGFEINYIGEDFNETIDSLVRHQNEAEQAKIAQERIEQELKIGYEIQTALLPTTLPEFPGLDIATGFLPAREVGGDFYDLFVRDDKTLFIIIADTAGKGIGACLYSLGLRSTLRSFASTCNTLDEILHKTNELFCLDTKDSGMFVTLWAAIFNPQSKVLTYCNMGHHPAYFRNERGKVQELTTTGMALGVESNQRIETKSIQVQQQDSLLLFTDGVVEAENKRREFFGTHRLLEHFTEQDKNDSQYQMNHLLEQIERFCEQEPFLDDLTIVLIHFL